MIRRYSAGWGRQTYVSDDIGIWNPDICLFNLRYRVSDIYGDLDAARAKYRSLLSEMLERQALGLTESLTWRNLVREVRLHERVLTDLDMAEGLL